MSELSCTKIGIGEIENLSLVDNSYSGALSVVIVTGIGSFSQWKFPTPKPYNSFKNDVITTEKLAYTIVVFEAAKLRQQTGCGR